jgi:hypothetical protein
MLVLLLHYYIQRQQQNIFSSLLFISRDFHDGYSSHGTNSQNKIHKGLKQNLLLLKNLTLRRWKKIVDQIWQATQ